MFWQILIYIFFFSMTKEKWTQFFWWVVCQNNLSWHIQKKKKNYPMHIFNLFSYIKFIVLLNLKLSIWTTIIFHLYKYKHIVFIIFLFTRVNVSLPEIRFYFYRTLNIHLIIIITSFLHAKKKKKEYFLLVFMYAIWIIYFLLFWFFFY